MAEQQIRFDDGAAYERMMGGGAGSRAMYFSTGWHLRRGSIGSISGVATVRSLKPS